MEETKVKTLSEIHCLLNYFPKMYVDKIPPKLFNLINHFSNSKYFIDVDTEKPLEEQNISEETKNMLIVFKYNYWSNEEEKREIIKQLNENEKKYQEELREKYNPDNLFKNKDIKAEITEQPVAMVEYKESIFRRIINRIKIIFKRY